MKKPHPCSFGVSVMLTEATYDRLLAMAVEDGVSVAAVVRGIVVARLGLDLEEHAPQTLPRGKGRAS